MAPDRLEQNARTVTLMTLASRVTGLLRDATLSRAFGVGPVMDAFAFGFMMPNLFRRLFGEGALGAAFLPAYVRLEREDPRAARRLAALTIVVLALVLNAVVFAAEVGLLTARLSFHDSEVGASPLGALGYDLLMVMLPYLPLVSMVAIVGSMLQAHDRFAPVAASPAILNLTIVAVALGMLPVFSAGGEAAQGRHALIVGASVVVAGVLQLGWALWAARGHGFSLLDLDLRDARSWAGLRGLCVTALPMLLGLGVLQVNTFVDGVVASWPTMVGPTILGHPFPLQEGAMAALGNAQRLYEFPLGVFGVAVASAIFPILARTSDNRAEFVSTVRRGMRLVVFVGLPASVGLMLIARPAVAVLLQGGRFTSEDTDRVAAIIVGYAPAIWCSSLVHVLTRALYALGNVVAPTRIACGIVGLNLVLDVLLILTPLNETGLAWATSTCSLAHCCALGILLRRRTGRLIDGAVARSWFATLAAAACMALCMGLTRAAPGGSSAQDWGSAVRELLILMATGAATVIAAVLALRRPELRWAIGRRSGL